MMFVDVQVVGRCAVCGQMISTDTIMHSTFAGMVGGALFCQGKIGGRTRTQVWITEPHTIKRTGEVVPSMYKGHKATPAEVRLLSTLIAQVKQTGKSVHQRRVEATA